ncbi:25S rRNA (adenine645-N1)-methyltransferase [Cladophialophora chaetospira]|uniref:Ribosomal RNA-processing protein 8 n=1 Tax=Cladophialophora chaetospira TaxID=386627 RepID=A0AA39CJ16_9EURO|nr:25S rRNA (adenine645-N1)-methyltransferase [Cladophialophora chaetospira]
MFAVPGWSVDAASIVQETSAARKDGQASSDPSKPASRKRKSAQLHNDQATKVSGSELEKLWNKRDGAKPAKSLQPERSGYDDRKPARNEHDRQAPDGRKTDEGKLSGRDGKSRKKDKKNNPTHTPDAIEQPAQQSRDHRSKERHTRLSNVNAEDASFPRDEILSTLPPAPPAPSKLTPLQAKMRSKLTSARFRHLNETLYTTSSSAAMALFTSSPDLFAEYHAGFSQQVKDAWPVNPVENYIAATKKRGQIQPSEQDRKQRPLKDSPLPRRPKTSLCTIADLGCGDAPLARGCQSIIKSHKLKFHNFDLHTPNTQVTKADISQLPLRDGEVDVAVFCLSLMGTNWISFVEEAWRVLRGDGKGECWGEAVENSVGKKRKNQKPNQKNGDDDEAALGEVMYAEDAVETAGDETDISAFVKTFTRRGFQLREDSVDKSNKMFVSMVFIKSGIPTAGKHKGLKWTGREYQKIDEGKLKKGGTQDEMTPQDEGKVLKPCVYKTR